MLRLRMNDDEKEILLWKIWKRFLNWVNYSCSICYFWAYAAALCLLFRAYAAETCLLFLSMRYFWFESIAAALFLYFMFFFELM